MLSVEVLSCAQLEPGRKKLKAQSSKLKGSSKTQAPSRATTGCAPGARAEGVGFGLGETQRFNPVGILPPGKSLRFTLVSTLPLCVLRVSAVSFPARESARAAKLLRTHPPGKRPLQIMTFFIPEIRGINFSSQLKPVDPSSAAAAQVRRSTGTASDPPRTRPPSRYARRDRPAFAGCASGVCPRSG